MRDIDLIEEWPQKHLLEELGATGGESVVLLVRGALVRLYPTVRIMLVEPGATVPVLPDFAGWIAPDVRFLSFAADPDVVAAADSKWEIVFEEQPTEPRFGLDAGGAQSDHPISTWDDLAWGHTQNQSGAHLVVENGLGGASPDGATWGRNSAHMARATFQKPFRAVFQVLEIIGAPA